MFKTIKIIVMAALCLNFKAEAQSQNSPPLPKNQAILGKVISVTTGEALPGAVIKVTTTNHTVISNDKGEFILTLGNGTYNLSIYYLSYKTKNISIQIPLKESLIIALDTDDKNLKEVEIVSTGYQNIPKERATGSFTLIDNKTLNRAVSPDMLSRLKGVTNGLLFDNTTGNSTGISVRGRSTIFSNTTPLIVVDNFPFEGDINSLNPDMIENVTVLKDAAAASIWGVRAGNGVIVITTKKGRLNQKPTISMKTDLTIGAKPDLFNQPQLSSSEFIDVEKFLFDKGAYNATINNGYATISPVVAILQKIKLNPAYKDQGLTEIEALKGIDIRDQLNKYFYQNSVRQHYSMDVTGGGQNQTYYFSAGFDKNKPNAVAQSNSRITLKGSNTYNLVREKLKLSTDLSFSKSNSDNKFSTGYLPYSPYEQIADNNGYPLPTVIRNGLRAAYTDTAGIGKLLDWKYRPLDELNEGYSNNKISLTDYRLNLGLKYKILTSLSLSVNYQYYSATGKSETSNAKESFYTRNLVNTFSNINRTTNVVTRPFPEGDIYSPSFTSRQSNYGRAQAEFYQILAKNHEISAIGGYEIRDEGFKSNSITLYGYNPETATNVQIDPLNPYPYYYNTSSGKLGNNSRQYGTTGRFVSLYGTAAYSYKDTYTVSGSYRKDESNLFGVKSNQKGVPLWSAGLAWNIYKESFFKPEWLSMLQLKATYGYNGNVNNSVSAYLTASPGFNNPYNVLYYQVINPPNDDLRWERVKNANIGLYFSSKKELITGSIEYYVKNGIDLIASTSTAPQTGVTQFTGNTADTHTQGIDVQINSKNINQEFKWSSNVIFNFVRDKITGYKVKAGSNSDIVVGSTYSLAPLQGYPINSVFAFTWAGLDASGNPLGYLDGAKSLDYTKIRNSQDQSQIDFYGSATPTVFGSLRNTFSYRGLELSFNITYKLNYSFRRKSLSYSALFSGNYDQPDYALRWQKAGDELITNVPSAVYPSPANRNDFYNYAAVLIQKGDHVRLQDIQLNYSLSPNTLTKLPFSNLNIYAYATKLGVLWKANKVNIDPDFRTTYPDPLSFAFGIKINF